MPLICLTPVKNEAWILERFLRCASLWADHIIVADQGSEDDTVAIATRFPKVTVVENRDPAYDEGRRQRLLLEAARRIEGPRTLVALDADEALTANWADSPEWQAVRAAPAGTVLRFRWVNLRPDMESGWVTPHDIPFGFVDDGSPHGGEALHSQRLPAPPGAPSLLLRDLKVLHYQYTDWPRMESKQRWYQCWEVVNRPGQRPANVYRRYHQMDGVRAGEVRPLRPEWLAGYQRQGIDMTSVLREGLYRWDGEVVKLLARYGAEAFRRLDIWDVDWARLGELHGLPGDHCHDPRGALDRAVLWWLRRTQGRYTRPHLRALQWLLRFVGW